MASKTNWLLGSNQPEIIANHYYILVTYLNKISDINIIPECYIISSNEIHKFIKSTGKGFAISYNKMRDDGTKHKENWDTLKYYTM